jgi:hypothetical protein
MAEDKSETWIAEFKVAGIDKVRNELMLRRWPKDKIATARQWVEREDARNWQAARGPGTGTFVKRNKRWISYVIGAIGLAFAAIRAFRFMRHGF